jgi:hypothetical protein
LAGDAAEGLALVAGKTVDDLIVLQSVVLRRTGVVFLPSHLLVFVTNFPFTELARFNALEFADARLQVVVQQLKGFIGPWPRHGILPLV